RRHGPQERPGVRFVDVHARTRDQGVVDERDPVRDALRDGNHGTVRRRAARRRFDIEAVHPTRTGRAVTQLRDRKYAAAVLDLEDGRERAAGTGIWLSRGPEAADGDDLVPGGDVQLPGIRRRAVVLREPTGGVGRRVDLAAAEHEET